MSITIIIIAITVIVSLVAFSNEELKNKLMDYPYVMSSPAEWYRFITHGFIHSDIQHLAFNMISLFFLGRWVETYYEGINKPVHFIWLYISAIVISSLPAFFKNKDNRYYAALGASGGVSAIVFSFVYLAPWEWIIVLFIPIPAILFAILYVVYSYRMDRIGTDNKGHSAHLWGSIYGFLYTFIFDPYHGAFFIENLMSPKWPF